MLARIAAVLLLTAATAAADDKEPRKLTPPTDKPCITADEHVDGDSFHVTRRIWQDAQGRPAFLETIVGSAHLYARSTYDAAGWLVRIDSDAGYARSYETFRYGDHGELLAVTSVHSMDGQVMTNDVAFTWKGTFAGKATPPHYARTIAAHFAENRTVNGGIEVEGGAYYDPPAFDGTVTASGEPRDPDQRDARWVFDRAAGTIKLTAKRDQHTVTRTTSGGKTTLAIESGVHTYVQTWSGDQLLDETDGKASHTFTYDASGRFTKRSALSKTDTAVTATWSCK